MKRQVVFYLTALFFVVPNISWALVVGANNGSITFSEQNVGAARVGAPLFDANGKLIGPGGGFKDLNPPTPPQQGVAGAIAPPLAAVAAPGGDRYRSVRCWRDEGAGSGICKWWWYILGAGFCV